LIGMNTVALVFPVWWWTQPAVMKAWLDRVGNSE
jgi:putative NADPH-quinone reductase